MERLERFYRIQRLLKSRRFVLRAQEFMEELAPESLRTGLAAQITAAARLYAR